MHVAGAHRAAILGPFFSHERPAHRPFAPDADARQQPEDRELPDARRDGAEKREDRVAEDRQHQRADAAEAIGDGPPQQRQSPADEKQREQHAVVIADVAGRGGDARSRQQLGQCGHQHERVDERVHAVERPAAPGRPKAARLIACERSGHGV